jgi:hypothetical protein
MIRMRMNGKLAALVQAVGIPCAPLIDQGPLRDLCFHLKETVMGNQVEGVVLTGGDGCLFKWKTSLEDESKGHDLLHSRLVSHSTTTLALPGIDFTFVQLLIAVADKIPAVTRIKTERKKKQKIGTIQAYDEVILKTALASAMSKYDALEAYFERGERVIILANLKRNWSMISKLLRSRRSSAVSVLLERSKEVHGCSWKVGKK